MFFSERIGIDIGTTMIRVYVKGTGIVVEQPSYVAYDSKSGKVVAVGEEARQLEGKENRWSAGDFSRTWTGYYKLPIFKGTDEQRRCLRR